MYNDCDMVSDAAEISVDTSAELNGEAYRERMKEMFQVRELLRAELKKEFDQAEIDKMRQAFLSGSIEDAGVLRRCVLKLLFRSWGMR
jgi:ADP-ribose pyrophosphatase YjhB (NUDIX family)